MKKSEYFINDHKLSVLEAGDSNNPVVLLLHGIPASSELWRHTMNSLSNKGYYCLAPDLPGYGSTEVRGKAIYKLPDTASLILRWLREMGYSKIWLIGHDIGGGIAQLMITSTEDLFIKLTLSNCITADTWPVPSVLNMVKASRLGLFYLLALMGRFSEKKLYHTLIKSFKRIEKMDSAEFKAVFYDGKFHQGKRVRKFQSMLAALQNSYTQQNMQALSKVNIPTHLIWGMSDTFQPWNTAGQTLEKTFKQVKVTKIEKCGHFLQLDAPEDYMVALLA